MEEDCGKDDDNVRFSLTGEERIDRTVRGTTQNIEKIKQERSWQDGTRKMQETLEKRE